MDITALVSRDKAYFDNLVANTRLTMFLPDLDVSLICSATVEATATASVTTITAPFTPNVNSTVSNIQVLEKAADDPVSYSVVWLDTSSATLTPSPTSVSTGDLFTIGTNTYEVSQISGDDVTFTTPVAEVAVFYANVATPDVTYQWEISEDGGTTWIPIPGATSRSYEATSGDVGDDLRVIISYVDGQGTIEQPSLSPPETQPQVIFPQYPVIADIALDLSRSYAANLLANLIVSISSE